MCSGSTQTHRNRLLQEALREFHRFHGVLGEAVGADLLGPLRGHGTAAHDDLILVAQALGFEEVDDFLLAGHRGGHQGGDELTGCLGVVYPTFEEYPNRMQEDKVIAYVPQNKDFSYTADDLMAFFAVREVAAILLINPDNPSGNYISKVDVVHLAKWCKDKKVTLVVDESFVDFSEQSVDNTLLTNEILEENPNLVVVKSISKSYGVPGLRLGILASSNLLLIDRVRKNVPIWNINSFAEFYMQIFNKYEQDYKQACRLFIRERDRFYVDLQQIGYLRVIPSQANYFLCEVISKYSSKELTELLLNEYNILIKDCGTKKAFRNGEYIRIAVRSTLDNQRLIDALKEL